MKIDELKIYIENLMKNKEGKVMFAKKIGRRNEYIFSIGETNYAPSEILFEDNKYVMFVESLSDELQNEIMTYLKA